MRKTLRTLAEIRVGHSFRTGIENNTKGDVRVLQIRDIKGGEIAEDSLPRIQWSATALPPLLRPGDVVLPSRGERYDAALIRHKTPTIASGHLYIVHPSNSSLTPEYLCWFLNQPEARNYILKNRAGTGIPTLSRQVLEDLPVRLPKLEVQHKIVELQKLWQREQLLTLQLLANRQKMLDGMFNKFLES